MREFNQSAVTVDVPAEKGQRQREEACRRRTESSGPSIRNEFSIQRLLKRPVVLSSFLCLLSPPLGSCEGRFRTRRHYTIATCPLRPQELRVPPASPSFLLSFDPRNYSRIYVNEETNEQVSLPLCTLSPCTSSLSVDGLSERQTARRMERIRGTRRNTARKGGKERKKRRKKRKKEGKRSAERTPFTAQWVPLKPKVMKVSGCLSQFLYRAPIHNLTTPYGTHDTYIPGVRLRTTRTMRSIRL